MSLATHLLHFLGWFFAPKVFYIFNKVPSIRGSLKMKFLYTALNPSWDPMVHPLCKTFNEMRVV